jgi:hypothetical protein
MNDRVAVVLRITGLMSLGVGLLIGYFAMTASPSLYPPIQASYLIIATILAGAGFLAFISKYTE